MKAIATIFIVFGIQICFGQNETDALRYSQNSFGGSAHYSSMAGSFGAIGGEISALGTNPAGIGIFRKTEMNFTIGLLSTASSTIHYGNTVDGYKFNANIPEIGLVTTYNIKSESRWKTTHFGLTYSRNTSLHSQYVAEGVNPDNSLLDLYKYQLENENFDAFGSKLAWDTYLIDTVPGVAPTSYFTAINKYGETQRNVVTTKGKMSEIDFSFGANYDNRLYLGATIGIPSVKYSRESEYSETMTKTDTASHLDSFTLNEKLTTTGSGFNLKLGAIYRINDFVRVGAAVHTPSVLTLNDEWSSKMEAIFQDSIKKAESPVGNFDYSLVTPFRAIGSIGVIVGKMGLFNIDYEYINYSNNRLFTSGAVNYSFSGENNQISTKYTTTGNIRFGTEWRLDDFRVRGGYALYGNPFKNNVNNDNSKASYTLGFGYRTKYFYFDFGYILTKYKNVTYLYTPEVISPIEPTIQNFTSNNFVTTVGFRF